MTLYRDCLYYNEFVQSVYIYMGVSEKKGDPNIVA